MFKPASELIAGDVWREGPDMVRMMRTEPYPVPSIVRIIVAKLSDETEMTLDFYRVNKRDVKES